MSYNERPSLLRKESKKSGAHSAHLTSTIGYLVRATLSTTICQKQIETVHLSAHSELQDFFTRF